MKILFRYRRKICSLLTLKIFLVTIVLTLCIIVYKVLYSCSIDNLDKALALVCLQYKQNQTFGNFCSELCDTNNVWNKKCLPRHSGKDIVLIAKWKKEKILLKAAKIDPILYEHIHFLDENYNTIFPDVNSFLGMVKQSLEINLNISLSENGSEIIKKIWPSNFESLPDHFKKKAMNDIWHLIQQMEYVFLKYFENFHIFPKIFGTCSHIYVMEYVEPIGEVFKLFSIWGDDFSKRANVALLLLKYIETLETYLPQPLHICDMKMEHFGLSKNSLIKILDMDMVLLKSALINNILFVDHCRTDDDCSFIHCAGNCNRSSNKCESRISDSNLQRACSKLFAGYSSHYHFGLLSAPPVSIRKELNKVLDQCIKMTSPETYIKKELFRLLTKKPVYQD